MEDYKNKSKEDLIIEIEKLKKHAYDFNKKDFEAKEKNLISEGNLNTLINNRDESIWSLDKALNFSTFNDFFAKAFFDAYQIELKKGMNALDILSTELVAFWKPKYQDVLSGEKLNFEFPFVSKGNTQHFSIFLNPITSNGTIIGLSAISSNITERKNNEKNIDFLKQTASHFVSDTYDLDIYSYIGKKLKELIPDAYIIISEIENKNIIPRSIIGIENINKKVVKLLGHNPIGKKYEYDEELLEFSSKSINKFKGNFQNLLSASMPRTISAPIEKLLKIDSIYAIAFVNEQKIFANAAIVFPKGKDLKEKETLETFIKQASLALKRKKTESELIKANKLSEESEAKYKALVENSHDGIYIHKNNQFLFVNKVICKLLGYTKEELFNMSIWNIIHPDDQKRIQQYSKDRLAGKNAPNIFQSKILTKDCKIKYAEFSVRFINYMGEQVLFGAARDITEQKIIDLKIKDSEKKYRALFNGINDAIFVHPLKKEGFGNFLEVNEIACKRLGYSKEELLNLTAEQISIENTTSDQGRKEGRTKLLTEQWRIFETVQITKSGKEFPVEISSTIFKYEGKLSILSLVKDITKRKQDEKELSKSLKKDKVLAEILRHSPIAIAFGYPDGSLDNCNVAFCKLTGYTKEELKTINWNDTLTPQKWQKPEAEKLAQLSPENNTIIYEKEYITKTGKIIPIELVISANFDNQNRALHYIAFITDITERKKVVEELQNHRNNLEQLVKERTLEVENKANRIDESQKAMRFLLEDVNDAREELGSINIKLNESNKDLESFAYSVSHDLKSPLRAINGYTNVLLEDFQDIFTGEKKEYLDLIVKNSQKMNMLIDDLLRFSRVGRNELDKSEFNLSIMVKDVLNSVKEDYSNIKINSNILENVLIRADLAAMKQVLVNIIGNAVKFSSKNELIEIEFGEQKSDDKTTYYIKDNGVGFDEKYKEKLFGVFQRLHSSDKFEGTGVGLALVKRILNKHGGDIWAESAIDKGSTFYFTVS